MSEVIFMNGPSNEPIEPKRFFGKDMKKLTRACSAVLRDLKNPYEGCYMPEAASLNAFQKENTSMSYEEFKASYLETHPAELLEVERSRKHWEQSRHEHFRKVYRLAKYHRIHLEWCGDYKDGSNGQYWMAYRKDRFLGTLTLMNSQA